ncbi:hypothetical protein [Streptomyces millisiae]|uniref:Uncharacterized protein n=1 Tax=Streptomyces millisiae TaxID=3075542 RepID=A0ABU2LRR2_9ACTN|nr:hypothetical protein [Streptomyces sp. DSM 44918]MDT0320287.1 hypothetical protein [Streptomyces sp. DSM 44918]
MDPISAAALAALAGGIGGEAGRQAWASLGALVRRPFRRGTGLASGADEPSVSSGEAELARLWQDPSDPDRASALSAALAVRAALDEGFRDELAEWWRRSRAAVTGEGEVTNVIAGGTQHGPVIQARDISGLSIGLPRSAELTDRPPDAS